MSKKDRYAMDCINESVINLLSDINDISNDTGYVLPPEQLAKIEDVQNFLKTELFGKK